MSFLPLHCHAVCNPPPGIAVTVAARRLAAGELQLSYRLQGNLAALRIPAPAHPAATDGLWQATCCEAFLASAEGTQYREFNFSPSGQWAIYEFTDYRQRCQDWQTPAIPHITCRHLADSLLLEAELPASLLPPRPGRLGLTLVMETSAGDKSYWALAHSAAQPDFHLASSFTLPLP